MQGSNLWLDDTPFKVKGVVYVPGYPGFLPWEIENQTDLPFHLRERIDKDLEGIAQMGANTIRLWGAPAYVYKELAERGDLFILQTIWIDGEAADFQDSVFKEQTKGYIRAIVDRIYAAYPSQNPPLLAFLVGNELSAESIRATNLAHPQLTDYVGPHFSCQGKSASEVFIAEMADFLRQYELSHYNRSTLLSYANEIRTIDLLDIDFLDFRSFNAYSYAVPYYKPFTQPGSQSGTLFQGWVEEVQALAPQQGLLITETGLSVSPNVNRVGPPNYSYGGNTELDQAQGILQNLADLEGLNQAPMGVCIHEYLDAWWKFGLQDSYSQDPNDIEEWFGLVRLKQSGNWYTTELRPAYDQIKAHWSN